MPPSKKKFIMQSRIQSSNTMARYMSTSSSSSSSAPPTTSSPIDLTSSLPPTTASASTSQRDGGKTSYIWAHGKKIVRNRWIICDFDELWGEIINWKKRAFWSGGSWRQVVMSAPVVFLVWTGQSECEKVDLWLKINDLIGHHGFWRYHYLIR